jgi:hypothetical protein
MKEANAIPHNPPNMIGFLDKIARATIAIATIGIIILKLIEAQEIKK